MKQSLFLILVCMVLIACNQTNDNRPKLFLDVEKMKFILMEVHLSDAIAEQQANGNRGVEAMLAQKGLTQILKNNQLTQAQLDSNLSYYQLRPVELNKIYEQILADLSKRQAEMSK
jgi:hypothetical protein